MCHHELQTEIDYIILRSVVRCGYTALPLDYSFLRRYSLMSLYIEIVRRRTADCPSAGIERALRCEVLAAIRKLGSISLCRLNESRDSRGNGAVKELLRGSEVYWRTYLVENRKLKAL